MYSSVDIDPPRPIYQPTAAKFDIYTWPFSIRMDIKKDLGEFPFPAFWGSGGLTRPRALLTPCHADRLVRKMDRAKISADAVTRLSAAP
jgi:hypothetical protein